MNSKLLGFKGRKWTAAFLAWMMVVSISLSPLGIVGMESVQAAPPPFDGGDGSQGNPHTISTPEQLYFLSEKSVRDTVYSTSHYKLNAPTDLSAYGAFWH